MLAQQPRRVGTREEALAQRRAAGAQLVLPAPVRVARRAAEAPWRRSFMASSLAPGSSVAQPSGRDGGGGDPADSVSTS